MSKFLPNIHYFTVHTSLPKGTLRQQTVLLFKCCGSPNSQRAFIDTGISNPLLRIDMNAKKKNMDGWSNVTTEDGGYPIPSLVGARITLCKSLLTCAWDTHVAQSCPHFHQFKYFLTPQTSIFKSFNLPLISFHLYNEQRSGR